jgi:hypothetical protein
LRIADSGLGKKKQKPAGLRMKGLEFGWWVFFMAATGNLRFILTEVWGWIPKPLEDLQSYA